MIHRRKIYTHSRDLGYSTNVHAYEPIPLAERPRDRLFIAFFLVFACTSFFVDRLAALDVDMCAEQSLGGSLCWYGRHIDPLFLANPQWLRVISGISAWIYGPLYVLLAWAFWRGVESARGPALAWAITILYSLCLHLWMEFFGDHPPPHGVVLMLVYLPYVLVPIAALLRLRDTRPFSRMI